MEFRKTVLMNVFAGQQWRHRLREQTCGPEGREWGGSEMNGECIMVTYTLPYVK